MHPPTARRASPPARRALLLLLFVFALFAGMPGSPASAHAYLAGSTPGDGVVVAAPPAQIALHFSESVVLAATHIEVVDADGHHFRPTALRLLGGSSDTEDPTSVVATMPTLPKNAYRISWETLSSDDLHRTSGIVVFGVGRPVTAAPLSEPLPRPDEAGLRWLIFLSLALALGGGFAARLLRREGVGSSAARRCDRLSLAGAAAGSVLAIGLLVDQLATGGWAAGRLLLGAYGQRWMVREGGLLLLLAAGLTQVLRPGALGSRARLLIGPGAAAACIGSALLGHSGATHGFSLTRLAADAAHLGAAAVWAGTVIAFASVTPLMLRSGGRQGVELRAALRGFGIPAAVCVGVMVVTGLYLSSDVIGSVDAALLTFYGRTLLLKVVIVGIAGGFGLFHAVRLHGRRSTTPRRTLGFEAAAAAFALLLAALLTSAQPATEPQLVVRAAPATVPVVDGQAADLQETLAVRPNKPGPNVALVAVFDTRRPAPAPVRAVDVTFQAAAGGRPVSVGAERLADGRWSVPVQLTSPGRLKVVVRVHRAGMRVATATYGWTVGESLVRAAIPTVSRAPLAPTLRALSAWSLAAMLGGGGIALAVRTRRRLRSRTARSTAPVPDDDCPGVRQGAGVR